MFPRKEKRFVDREDSGEREVDPFSIFAGSLDTTGPDPWHEERVRNVFSKYGEIEEIQFVLPGTVFPSLSSKFAHLDVANPSAAFAFIKYTNTVDSAKAVAAEVSQLLSNRAMNPWLTRVPHFCRILARSMRDRFGFNFES